MKKLSLKNVKEALTRSEMRSIMGGSGSSGSTWQCCWNGTTNCSTCAGWGTCDPGSYIRKCQ